MADVGCPEAVNQGDLPPMCNLKLRNQSCVEDPENECEHYQWYLHDRQYGDRRIGNE
ncbi:hypothetical protein LCGC14_0316590 [marine sediment metagenome]|uniref:Uncharacterized protein n=1 Tax=marine sediment metagenome TaxID=412755 RepID=A0A0F9U359_9ZZZZ